MTVKCDHNIHQMCTVVRLYGVYLVMVVPEYINVYTKEFTEEMEVKLAGLYAEGLEREELLNKGQFASFNKRKKRYVTEDTATIQVRCDVEYSVYK